MKKLNLLVVVLVLVQLLACNSIVFAEVPHPNSSYDLSQYSGTVEEVEMQVREKYTVEIEPDQTTDTKQTLPWKDYSYATL